MPSRRLPRVASARPVVAAAVCLVLAAAPVLADQGRPTYADSPNIEPNGLTMAADFLVARPLGLVATVAGTGLFVLALPFAALAGDIATPADYLVGQPARFTFARPLGEVEI